LSNASVGHELGSPRRRGEAVNCPVCRVKFTVTRKTQVCCSRDCYLIYWGTMKFLEALRTGKAEGLRAQAKTQIETAEENDDLL